MTIKEFAKHCNVSPATISRYFSGAAGLSDSVRDKISMAVEEIGYKPASHYQRRKRVMGEYIIVITPRWGHRFCVDLLIALQKQCLLLGKRMIVMEEEEVTADEFAPSDSRSLFKKIAPQGVVLLHEGMSDSFLEELKKLNIPCVMCGVLSLSRGFSSVHINDISAAYDGMNYLLGLGHSRIGIISDNVHAISSGYQRIAGCRKAMEDAGHTLSDDDIIYAGNFFLDGFTGTNELLDRNNGYSALFVFSDDMASGTFAALADRGVRVPEDISVLGFDGGSRAGEVRPLLTTVSQPIDLIARRSLEKLLSPQARFMVESITLSHEIIERDSCRSL